MAKKGAVEGVMAIIAVTHEYANGLTFLGGMFLTLAGGVFYTKDLELQLHLARMRGRKGVELVRLKALKDVEVARKEVQVAHRETAKKFVTYGLTREYSKYRSSSVTQADN